MTHDMSVDQARSILRSNLSHLERVLIQAELVLTTSEDPEDAALIERTYDAKNGLAERVHAEDLAVDVYNGEISSFNSLPKADREELYAEGRHLNWSNGLISVTKNGPRFVPRSYE